MNNIKLSQCICLVIFSYSAVSFFVPSFSYIIWSEVNLFACLFLLFSYFVFHFFIFIYNMKSSQSICLFVFSHSAIAFSFPSFSYIISWGESMYLLTRFLAFSYFFFFPSFSYYIWSGVNRFAYSVSCIRLVLFLSFIFILYMKWSQSICLFVFSHLAIPFSFLHFHIIYEVESMYLLYSLSRIQ
jgi:hypothetical protein